MEFNDWPQWDDIDRRCAELGRLVMDSPGPGLTALLDFVDGLDEDRLCQVGVDVVEPLLDLHFAEVGEEFEAALSEHPNLRKALSCAWLTVDEEIEARLRRVIGPEEDIGREQTDDPPKPDWCRVSDGPIREVRVPQLLVLLDSAAQAGVTNSIAGKLLERIADPGAGHLVWPRYVCVSPGGTPPPYYQCGVRFHLAHQRLPDAVCQMDLLAADVQALPEVAQSRIVRLLQSAMEKLPGIEEV